MAAVMSREVGMAVHTEKLDGHRRPFKGERNLLRRQDEPRRSWVATDVQVRLLGTRQCQSIHRSLCVLSNTVLFHAISPRLVPKMNSFFSPQQKSLRDKGLEGLVGDLAVSPGRATEAARSNERA